MPNGLQSSPAYCAERFRLLADTTRLIILKMLLNGPKRVWEMKAELGIEQSLLSHHLKILRQYGLVESQREGKSVLYRISPTVQLQTSQTLDLGCCTISFHPAGQDNY